MLDFLGDLRRTHMCGVLRASDAGKKAVLMGWVNRRRDHGNLLFVDLRDRSGVTQVVLNAERDAALIGDNPIAAGEFATINSAEDSGRYSIASATPKIRVYSCSFVVSFLAHERVSRVRHLQSVQPWPLRGESPDPACVLCHAPRGMRRSCRSASPQPGTEH